MFQCYQVLCSSLRLHRPQNMKKAGWEVETHKANPDVLPYCLALLRAASWSVQMILSPLGAQSIPVCPW